MLSLFELYGYSFGSFSLVVSCMLKIYIVIFVLLLSWLCYFTVQALVCGFYWDEGIGGKIGHVYQCLYHICNCLSHFPEKGTVPHGRFFVML
jgi:hypothetical protein